MGAGVLTRGKTDAGASGHPQAHFDALNSLRGVCALLVACFHFHVLGVIYGLPIVRYGWMFVDFFFVLSGFVVSHAYARRLAEHRIGIPRFLVLRLGRIYPLHLFVLLLLVAIEIARSAGLGERPAFDEAHSVPAILTNLALLQSMGVHGGNTWNGVSWSIAAEMWAYLLVALVIAIWPRRALTLFAGAGVLSLLVLLRFSERGLDATYDLGTWRAILGFTLGVLVQAAYVAGLRVRGTAAEIAASVAPLLFVSWVHAGAGTFLVLPLFAFAVLVFAAQSGWISRCLAARFPTFLGTISYSIYMTHGLVQLLAFEVIKRVGPAYGFTFGVGAKGDDIAAPPIAGDLVVLATIGGTIVLSAMTYRYVEVPARNWVRALAERRNGTLKVG